MRVTREHLALQLAYDKQSARNLIMPDFLTTARFELGFREMLPYGILDLVFEDDGAVFVAHGMAVDVVVLALREGPALLWPMSLVVEPDSARALDELIAPWLLALSRGRAMAGEHIRHYRPSPAFLQARERQLYGATPIMHSLIEMAPFVYARRFSRNRDVYINCDQGALAAAVVGTVARSITLAGKRDDFAERWYGALDYDGDMEDPTVAILDERLGTDPKSIEYAIIKRPHAAAAKVVVPVPVANDLLFTFDAADAPAASMFGVEARDRVERGTRPSQVPASFGGSSGRVALVVRDDASFAGDADTDSVAELAERLRGEGLEPCIITAGDPGIADCDIVHVFGAIHDEHVAVATATARTRRLPFVVSLEPTGPYATYHEDTFFSALRLSVDIVERDYYLDLFYTNRLSIDGTSSKIEPDVMAARDRAFEDSCADALGVVVGPGEDVAAFGARFPRLKASLLTNAPVLIAQEPDEAPIAHMLPAEPFLLLHGPFTRRSAFAHVLSALEDPSFCVVVAGPISDVDYMILLRRAADRAVIFIPDPTPGQIAAMYRRARAVVIPTLRPTGSGRLIRAALCGAVPVVPSISPLASLVPDSARFNTLSPSHIADVLHSVMLSDGSNTAEHVARVLAPLAEQRAAFSVIVDLYARATAAIS